MADPILSVRNLSVSFLQKVSILQAVRDVSFDLFPGEVLGLVGESGCGKSLTALSLLNLINAPGVVQGEVLYQDKNILKHNSEQLQQIRGGQIGIIFQEPMSALNPVHTIGQQIQESILLHSDLDRESAWQEALNLLSSVGIGDAERRIHNYPHELSGGMLQRVMISIALAGNPRILIADEPTTALDVTIQSQILNLLRQIIAERGMSMIFITHDFGVIAEIADRVAVMYAGKIVETGGVAHIFDTPGHPYTKGLFGSLPVYYEKGKNIASIAGSVPDLSSLPKGCAFHPRCAEKKENCLEDNPGLKKRNGHQIACFYPYSY